MSSRIRENVKHFFECFCEVVPPTEGKDAWIIQQYPDKYKDAEVLKSVPKFAYPYKFQNEVIQHYSFVLTDLESKWTFGFCRHDPKSETAIVVLSYLPWHQSFYKFLDTTAVLMHSSRTEDLSEFLSTLYNTRIAEPGKKIVIPFNRGQNTFTVDVPKPFQLPSIPENRNLTEYYNAVDTNNMMIIFASMLYERRIIFTSKKLKRLSACVQSANDIIYPMIWQHIFIPLLPLSLVDYLLAPMPFLIGVPDEVMKKVSRSEIGDVVILDADNNTVETPFDDLNNLPQDVITSLRKQLRNKSAVLGDWVPRAFLRALVQLIGGYRDALKFQHGQKVTFDEERFIETRPISLQPFLRKMLQLQIFQQFIEERLTLLNTGRGFSDEFEFELENYSAKSGSKLKQQYKEWTSSMKKEGTAFLKSVKEKANPAMKSAVKTVKDSGKGMKSAYKGLRSKLKDGQGGSDSSSMYGSAKPRSAPSSPTTKRKIMSDFMIPVTNYKKDASLAIKNANLQRSYSPLSPGSQPHTPDVLDTPRSGSPIEIPRIDLMNEMQDLLQLKLDTPPVDRSLKPVRSLENFKNTISSPASPDRWPIPPPRPSLPPLPSLSSNRFFLSSSHRDTRNLLQSPLDDTFSSPSKIPSKQSQEDLLDTSKAFIVGGGQNENGDPVFYLANRNSVDIVKLTPPMQYPPSRRKQPDVSEDLIRLDSTSDLDDFDPLKSQSSTSSYSTPSDNPAVPPLSVLNPLYSSSYENHQIVSNGVGRTTSFSRQDQDLLQDYGLNFNFTSARNSESSRGETSFDPFTVQPNQCSPQKQWTKFD
ncbi:DENN domain-containing protein 1B-like isoform X1 [Euwallacea similis]|uniref:DENN domain-containing protein 1B-like isoform X1 n=1 Tax=Euwallacea similis TaxID=1736056 RepID=UPI00344B8164